MRVRLIRKLADRLDGVDVSGHSSGDILELSRREAELLIAERWAEPEAVAERGGRPWPRAEDRRREVDRRAAHDAPISASADPAGGPKVEPAGDISREHIGTPRDDRDR